MMKNQLIQTNIPTQPLQTNNAPPATPSSPILSAAEPAKQIYWKVAVMVLVLLLLAMGAVVYVLQKRPQSQPVISDSSPTITPSPTIILSPTNTTAVDEKTQIPSTYSSWKTYTNERLRITFKLPSGQIYSVASGRVMPAGISISDRIDYSGDSRREELMRMYRLIASDIRVTEKTAATGQSYLIVEGLTQSAHAEGVNYAAVFSKGTHLIVIGGDLENADIVRGMAETLTFTGTPDGAKDLVSCIKYGESEKGELGKSPDMYSFFWRYTQKLDVNYLKTALSVDVHPVIPNNPEEFIAPTVSYTVQAQDISQAPYVQQLNFDVTKSAVIKAIGQTAFDKATELVFNFSHAYELKTTTGKFCNDVGTSGFVVKDFK